ncbi:MAG TPA: protein kinase [Terriglobia bacterium]|nr:protein kinase [Terriglobia bacterium]
MRTCPKCQRTYPEDMAYCPRDAAELVSAATATQAELEATLSQRFRIVRRLGAGGMGTVFLAEQIAVGNRPVALKVLLRKLLDDPEFLLRFQNEAGSTGRIRHPNVVTIYESGQSDDGSPYIAMEYLEGESLRQALKSRGALPVPECAVILQQVARGLGAAHKLGIIHRDLKPDNIFLTRGLEDELVVKVVDFGIAKLRESATHTMTGMVLGTPAYMSFEQASGMRSQDLDARSDIYSLGVVAYEMLTGRVPFHSDTPLGFVSKHLSEQPPPFRAVKPGLPATPQLEQAVMRALAKNRDTRYASVLDFARQFGEAAQMSQETSSNAPLPSTRSVRPEVGAVREPPPTPPSNVAAPRIEDGRRTAPSVSSQPLPAVPGFARSKPSPAPRKSRGAVWVTVVVFVLVVVMGYAWISRFPTETKTPPENPPVTKPQGNSTTQPGAGKQGATVQSPSGNSAGESSAAHETNAADHSQLIVAAKKQGDTYYDNGDYNKAIDEYQKGLKLAPSNAGLLKALQRAQTAKAAEEKFNQ